MGQAGGHERERSLYLASLVQNISDALISTDLDSRIIEWNPAAELMYGWKAEDVKGHIHNEFTQNEYVDISREEVIKTVMTSGIWKGELFQNRKDGSRFPVLASVSLVRDETGKPIGFVAINRDISERKKAEQVLRESETLFSKVFQSNPVGINIFRISDGTSYIVNDAFLNIIGYSRREVQEATSAELHLFVDSQVREVWMKQLREGRDVYNQDARIRKKSGEIKSVLASLNVIEINNESMVLVIATDITERKRAEEMLRESEERYRTLVEKAVEGIFVADSTGHYLDVNAQGCAMLGYSIDEILRMSMKDLLLPEDMDVTPVRLQELTSGKVILSERRMRRKDGSIFFAEISGKQLPDGRIQGIVRDITQRKQAEEQLRLSEERFSNAFHVSPAGITITRIADGKFIDANDSFCKMFGFSREEVIGHTSTELNLWTPEERSKLIQAQLALGGLQDFELQARSRSGEVITILFSSKPMDVEGEACHITTMIDITRRMKAERALQESEARYRDLIENIQDLICTHDLQGNLLFVNQAPARLLGYTPEELIGHNLRNFLVPGRSEGDPLEEYLSTIQRDGHASGYMTVLTKNGEKRTWEYNNNLRTEGVGAPIVRGMAHDITERVQVEEALRHSEQKFSMMFEKAPFSASLAHASDGRIEQVNEKFERLFGYTSQEAIGRTSLELGMYPDPESRKRAAVKTRNEGLGRDLEAELRTKAGEVRTFLINTDFVDIAGEKYLLTTAQDITERKRAEMRIVQMQRLYATLSQVNQTIVRVKNRDELFRSICNIAIQFGKFTLAWIGLLDEASSDVRPVAADGLDINQWSLPVVNIHEGEWKNGVIATAIHTSRVMTNEDAKADRNLKNLYDRIQEYTGHSSAAIPFRLRGKSIGVLSVVSSETDLFQTEEEVRLLEEMALDISFALETMEAETERKQAATALQEREQKLKRLLEILPVGVSILNADREIVFDNPALRKILQISEEGFARGDYRQRRYLALDGTPMSPGGFASAQAQKSGQAVYDVETGVEKENGEVIWTNVSAVPVDFPDWKLVIVTVDITERRQMEEALRESEEKYRAFFQNSMDAILLTLPDGSIQAANPAACKMLGRTEAEICRLSRNDLVDTTDPRLEALLEERARTGKFFGELTMFRSDGSPFPVELSSGLFQDGQGNTRTSMIIRDITERRRAEDERSEAQKLFQKIFDLSPVATTLSRISDKMIVDVNEATIALLGYTREELIGKPSVTIDYWADADERQQALKTLLNQGRIDEYEFSFNTKAGKKGKAIVFAEIIELRGERYALSAMVDITERKQAEEQIQRQLKRLNGLRDIDIAISSSFDKQIVFDVVLQKAISLLKVDAAALLMIDPHMQTMEYANGMGFHSNALHHTRLKLHEGYAGRAVQECRTIHIQDLMSIRGELAQALQLANENLVDYYGTPLIVKGEVKGVLEVYHRSPLNPNHEWLEFLETLAGQAAIAIDNAQLFEGLQRANAQLEQRVAQRTAELNQTNIELEHANRTKSEFLANMSHELRTPLNSILGMSESLLEQYRDPLSEHQQKYIQTMASSGQHLLDMINDILDISKIEAGKFDYFPEAVSVEEICRSSLSFVKSQASKKSINVTYTQDKSVAKIYADPRRLKQILVNLLTNAVKFTPEKGQVVLQVIADLEKDRIQFAVIDTGIGIAPGHLQQLFQPFVQIDSGLNRQQEGTGLGLVLVQRLTDLHGGSVEVESEVGKGSRFTINLPWGRNIIIQQTTFVTEHKPSTSKLTTVTTTSVEELTGHHVVLLAEDNMANILTVGDYLELHGYKVVVAHDGLEAIQLANQVDPNIILMDIQMPGMDGLETMRLLRANSRFARTPIIALTALAMPGDRERCLEAGANEYMSKPVSLKSLAKTIEDLLQQNK